MFAQTSLFAILVLGTTVLAQNPLNVRRVEDISKTLTVDSVSYRLPNHTRPEHYDISLTTNIHNADFNFSGLVKIDLVVINATSSITVHQRQLVILDVKLVVAGSEEIVALGPVTYDVVTEFLTVTTLNNYLLPVGSKYTLEIAYTGELRTGSEAAGFYRSSYQINGTTRWLATTQFQSTDARHAFPCYDETWLRANFTIRITHDASYNAISNMPVSSLTTNLDNTVTTAFFPTPSVASYLVAFVVSDFIYQSNEHMEEAFPHRVYSRSNAINATDLGLIVGEDMLNAFEDYFEMPFTLPKMDQIAVPDFAAGAMENWGLVTYREEYLLWHKDVDTFNFKYLVVSVIAHEFAHQWFGNLVTPKWWTYLWLNEGFAHLYAEIGTEWLYPEWKVLDAFGVRTIQNVFQSDALESTRAMTTYAESPRSVQNLFDNIAYHKSGSVLRMILHAISEKTFVKGLNYYSVKHQYSAAVEEDLFEALQQAAVEDGAIPADHDIASIMSSWTQQKGFPIVIVNRNYSTGSLQVDQERYFAVTPSTPDNAKWWIPLKFVTEAESDFTETTADEWCSPAHLHHVISQTSERTWTNDEFIVFNPQQTSYYRVLYDARNYALIATALSRNIDSIHLVNRGQLLDDAFDFALTGRLSYEVPLNLTKFLENDFEYVPWAAVNRGLTQLNRVLSGSNNYHQFLHFLQTISEPLFNHIGIHDIEDEPIFHKQSRLFAINWACIARLPACVQATREHVALFVNGSISIHQNLFPEIVCNGLRNGSSDNFLDLLRQFENSDDPTERQRLTVGLACTTDEGLLTLLIRSSIELSTTAVEGARIVQNVARNSVDGTLVAIRFLIKNLAAVQAKFGSQFNTTITNVVQHVVNDELRGAVAPLVELLRNNNVSDALLARVNEIIANTKLWQDNHQEIIENWLIRNNGT